MKKLKHLLIVGVGLLLASCENFLDRQPESSLSVKTFWTSEQDLKTWNAGMYDGLQSTLRTNWLYWGELRSGVYTERGTAYDRNLLYNGLNSQSSSSSWSDLYKTIYRANAAIKHIPTSPVASSVSAIYLGQAYGMRALMYFYAIRVWGGVPKITEPMEDISSQEEYYGRTSVEDLKTFILGDIEKALEYIGTSTDMSSASKYYLNRGSIMALRTDVLMWYKEYDKALVSANDLLTNYKYSLEPASTYSNMFLNPSNSKEMIFNLFWNYEEDGNGFGYAQEIASGSNTIRYHPTKVYYKELVARKSEDKRVTMIMDTLAISYFITPDEMVDESYEKAMDGDYGNPTYFQIKCPKFVQYGATANEGRPGYAYEANGSCSTQMPIYRLTDIILLKAEALVLGTKKDYQGAIDIVNQVRARAGWQEKAKLEDYPTEKDLIKLIIDERAIEFWAEGKHWFDLVRNDMVKEYLDPYLQDEDLGDQMIPEGFIIGDEKAPNQIGGYGRILWPLNQDVFRKNPSMRGQQNKPYEE